MATEKKDTYVLGLNSENEIKFFKIYDYENQKDEAQKDLKEIQEQNLIWEIGDLKNKIQNLLTTEKKWNDLDDKIGRCYPDTLDVDEDDLADDDDYEDDDLGTIGEIAASAFGYL